MALGTTEQIIYDYITSNPAIREFWTNQIIAYRQTSSDEHAVAESLEKHLMAVYLGDQEALAEIEGLVDRIEIMSASWLSIAWMLMGVDIEKEARQAFKSAPGDPKRTIRTKDDPIPNISLCTSQASCDKGRKGYTRLEMEVLFGQRDEEFEIRRQAALTAAWVADLGKWEQSRAFLRNAQIVNVSIALIVSSATCLWFFWHRPPSAGLSLNECLLITGIVVTFILILSFALCIVPACIIDLLRHNNKRPRHPMDLLM